MLNLLKTLSQLKIFLSSWFPNNSHEISPGIDLSGFWNPLRMSQMPCLALTPWINKAQKSRSLQKLFLGISDHCAYIIEFRPEWYLFWCLIGNEKLKRLLTQTAWFIRSYPSMKIPQLSRKFHCFVSVECNVLHHVQSHNETSVSSFEIHWARFLSISLKNQQSEKGIHCDR